MYAILCKVQTHSILYTLALKYYVFSQAELNRSSKMSAFTHAFGLLLPFSIVRDKACSLVKN